MTVGSIVEKANSQLVGGPKLFSFTVTIESGDTSASLDLSSYFATEISAISGIEIFTAAAAVAMATIDYTTTAKTLALTFADPSANATIYATVLGF